MGTELELNIVWNNKVPASFSHRTEMGEGNVTPCWREGGVVSSHVWDLVKLICLQEILTTASPTTTTYNPIFSWRISALRAAVTDHWGFIPFGAGNRLRTTASVSLWPSMLVWPSMLLGGLLALPRGEWTVWKTGAPSHPPSPAPYAQCSHTHGLPEEAGKCSPGSHCSERSWDP